ncbi:unnamed protein product [Orchesella dallaii]|uniref:Uncharacterized protein n=1 Tax=Orchesella dallaii TaxID=48710 RepID=A0ABP1RVP9_9HEXA
MPKRKGDQSLEQKIAAARKAMLTAAPRSQEYKEAKKFLEECEAKKKEKDVTEQPGQDETEEDSSDEDDGTDEDDDDDDGVSDEPQPSSSKRTKGNTDEDKGKVVGGGKKKGKISKVPKKKSMKTIVKNYAPDEKADDNIIFFDGNIGSGYSVKLSKWLKNEMCYIQIRKNSTAGANVPATLG